MSTAHLTDVPRPRRQAFTMVCCHCPAVVPVCHDAQRTVCPACVQDRIGKPGPIFPPLPAAKQLELTGGAQ